MKRILYSFVAVLFATSAMAQPQSDIRTATLVHGDQTTVYYGVSALKNAYKDAAAEGDIIVLSPGSFIDGDLTIKKSISIYGCGYTNNETTGSAKTTLPSITISYNEVTDDENNKTAVYPKVYIEGCEIDGSFIVSENSLGGVIENLCLKKCTKPETYRLNYDYSRFRINAPSRNCRFIQCCNIATAYDGNKYIGFSGKQEQLTFENCVLSQASGSELLESTVNYNHCIIVKAINYGYSHFSNCVILNNSLPANCTAYNNILYNASLGSNVTGEGNYLGLTKSDVFEDEGFYVMKTPDVHVGTDGTQIGIYGGAYPFDSNSSIPKITSSNIDIQTATDGKLNVSITVKAQTK